MNVDGEGEAFDSEVHGFVEHSARRARAPQRQRLGATAHAQGSQKADDAQIVVSVKVREEGAVDCEAGAEANHLALAAFTTVEEQQVSVGFDHHARDIAVKRRRRG